MLFASTQMKSLAGLVVLACQVEASRLSLTTAVTTSDMTQCVVRGPEGSGLMLSYGIGSGCKVKCTQTLYKENFLNEKFASTFEPQYEQGTCHCRDKLTKQSRLPPFMNKNACTPEGCWEFYNRILHRKREQRGESFVNFYTADTQCQVCYPDSEPRCDAVTVEKSFDADALRKLQRRVADHKAKREKERQAGVRSADDDSSDDEDEEELSAIMGAIKTAGVQVEIPDELRWAWPEDPACSKTCADENGPGQTVGEHVCQRKPFGAEEWTDTDSSDCDSIEERPEPEECGKELCRAAWTTEPPRDDGSVARVGPGGSPGDLPDKDVELEEDKDGSDKKRESDEAIDSPEDGEPDEDDGSASGKKSGGNVDTEDTWEPAILEKSWGACSAQCITPEMVEASDKGQQHRSVMCVVETSPGQWQEKDESVCEILHAPSKPSTSRDCTPEPSLCTRWVVNIRCENANGAAVTDDECNGSRPQDGSSEWA